MFSVHVPGLASRLTVPSARGSELSRPGPPGLRIFLRLRDLQVYIFAASEAALWRARQTALALPRAPRLLIPEGGHGGGRLASFSVLARQEP